MLNYEEIRVICEKKKNFADGVNAFYADEDASLQLIKKDVFVLNEIKKMVEVAYINNLFEEENGYNYDLTDSMLNETIYYISAIRDYCNGYQQAMRDMKEGN